MATCCFVPTLPNGMVTSSKKFYVRFGIRVWKKGEEKPVFEHDMNLASQRVCVYFPMGTLGDILAWFPYVERFRQQHGCEVVYTMAETVASLFARSYPQLKHVDVQAAGEYYASDRMGLFFDDAENDLQPMDFRLVGLHRTAAHILGVDDSELRPQLSLRAPRTIAESYVCIAVQASTQCKKWNNPTGWRGVIAHFKARCYRVLCIDREDLHGQAPAWTSCPPGAEDLRATGRWPNGWRCCSTPRRLWGCPAGWRGWRGHAARRW
ncbi:MULTISPECIES: autotransporter strand-loop-strand O-heptosyltransferase [Paraburkholderia]|uniref:autotransporter strand-loop-strand O-heptosyltransferase n=1 Tax=Paraburkholderia TaxID=1822464 RepID=UPI00224DAA79|nr:MULTISPECIES: autotransporter strand-loop-strand O-heptosyltransferase [Paraburkholderia]MCX4159749.1 autotransporter strand-loop-strand O-heptosyltransferase [Paraburkholderia aspalathi]MDN7169146.1 autotransporter strand-loop-strand O-heptosyltransferase [Paraburkholderia sp. SECH2]MDQ6397634.1 autotransporter strand-loop-strand O-heptosyltransferase [Paraburkholderia aspalathi]